MRVTKTPTDEINFDNIAAMLCGEDLTEEQEKDVKELRRQYEVKKERKDKHSKKAPE